MFLYICSTALSKSRVKNIEKSKVYNKNSINISYLLNYIESIIVRSYGIHVRLIRKTKNYLSDILICNFRTFVSLTKKEKRLV